MKAYPRAEVFRQLKVDKSSFYRWAKERQTGKEKDVIKEQIDKVFWRQEAVVPRQHALVMFPWTTGINRWEKSQI